ncbi:MULTISPECIES: serine/threonine-protein kinase [unclassified Rathayibacter]|uniref:serine/threonine-protein kinase n=1 Tax=unclassified Rathayibacter TaxID=2609250 RepID=UPI00188A8DE2|nr:MULTISPECIES: serine/threonine-protein kinase [unclassified Rathayibacter]MBF4463379.1 serine/threonine protein kinase [Rathayibacter sp. VKM Ac-2879]MBF4504898.1 serine/threonine protein kinase [Rathayibacter sp. VKM Ac-2878]
MARGSGEALGAHYRLLERIGAGAFGEVWRVRDSRDGSELAAKLLRRELVHDPGLVERFVRERSVLTRLRHPRVVAVRDLVVEGETLALVMELVGGGSLRDLLVAEGPLAPEWALAATGAVLEALAAAHAIGIVHRDVKPDNVLLAAGIDDLGQAVRVSDFGIARVVSEGPRSTTGVIGTPEYLSPEMLTVGEAGPPSDVYAAGILLYELLSGRTPFAGAGTDLTVAYRHVSTVPPQLELPERVARVLDRMLAKDPAARPTAAEAAGLLRALEGAVAGLPARPRAVEAPSFEEAARPATLLRGGPAIEERGAEVSPGPVPELGPASSPTIVRPVTRRELRAAAPAASAPATPASRRREVRMILAAVGAALVLVGAVLVAILPRAEGPPSESSGGTFAVQQQDRPLPAGLGVARSASYDSESRVLSLRFSYSAQSAPLSAPLLEVLPGMAAECPAVSWSGAVGVRNRPSVTGVGVDCGWSLTGVEIPAQGSVEVAASMVLDVGDPGALRAWLDRAAAATAAAVSDVGVSGTAYAVQRIRDVRIETPARTVSQTALPVTLVPVWPAGVDPVNPLFTSPSTGRASGMLDAIAGGVSGVRLSDGCGGAVAVSSDGLTVTALSMTPACELRARVGNFADLASDPFAITTRE